MAVHALLALAGAAQVEQKRRVPGRRQRAREARAFDEIETVVVARQPVAADDRQLRRRAGRRVLR
jgi:hypothetical protein